METKQSEPSLVVKVGYQDQVRRVTLEGTSTQNSFVRLRKWIEELFEELPEKWMLQYVDDEGDVISISTETEFNEAVKILKKMKVPSLKFALVEKTKPSNTENSNSSKNGPVEILSSLLNNIDISLEKPQETPRRKESTHETISDGKRKLKEFHNASCDGCNSKIPANQTRFKCNECRDFDFCEGCRWSVPHNETHSFVEITDAKLQVHRVPCKNCEITIVGDRFKCLQCPDYSLCSSCFPTANQFHKDHSFEKYDKAFGHNALPTFQLPPQVLPFVSGLLKMFQPEDQVQSSPQTYPNSNNNSTTPVSLKPEESKSEKMEQDSKYSQQMSQLKEMGFTSEEENLAALEKTDGDLVKAILLIAGL